MKNKIIDNCTRFEISAFSCRSLILCFKFLTLSPKFLILATFNP